MMKDLESVTGLVFDIQHYAVHDGPVIRTIVFLKGCNMRCPWCGNPEGIETVPEIMYNPALCIGEYACIEICPVKAIKRKPGSPEVEIDRALCSRCLECAKECTPEAIRTVGKEMTAGVVIEELLSDRIFYGESGGLTISGGEPFLQTEFTIALLRLAAQYHLLTAVETNGSVESKALRQTLPYTDHLLFDLKHMDSETHRRFTGIGNEQVLRNLIIAVHTKPEVIVRMPVIPGFNMNERDLLDIAEYAQKAGVKKLHLLPYHTLGSSKSELLGRKYPYEIDFFNKNLFQGSQSFGEGIQTASGTGRKKLPVNACLGPENMCEMRTQCPEELKPYKRLIEAHKNLQVTIGG